MGVTEAILRSGGTEPVEREKLTMAVIRVLKAGRLDLTREVDIGSSAQVDGLECEMILEIKATSSG